ncbi:MAG: M23 family metallopeptidase [Rickettsiales bacterium]|nr:M23 family metallopeptidase [Pseudomonadota bacterium]MDA0966063.1 M23 family metallopeptidase [Pseudomonadota bacterium]MDG4544245.1 M23 family metallopeptidase [Rickettsiales bacterium]MDG4546424.1 M23 family metallopeptidase [Rickettsiales bacterium]MDG4548570.1 M23 family metallopeptidase [Rickettsiales bacterium]
MIKNALKHIWNSFSLFATKVAKEVSDFVHKKLCEKKIVIISQNGIVNIPISFRLQLSFCFLVIAVMLWVSYSTDKYFSYDSILSEKELEIWNTNNVNEDLQYKVADLHNNLVELNRYFDNIRKYDQLAQKNIFEKNGSLKVADAGSSQGDEVQGVISNIRSKVLERIDSLETIIEMTGLQVEEVATNNNDKDKAKTHDNSHQGGPFIPFEEASSFESVRPSEFNGEIEYLLKLEEMVHSLPIGQPMEKYWISSGYGKRVDPFRKRAAIHAGMDMVGRYKSKIFSSAPGVVVKAGSYGAYGEMVEIDHGNGVATRYGHLSKILVKKGETVGRGDAVGVQGSSGRSTGDHLHYEVRYNDKTLNPKNFLKAGKYVF